MYNILLCLLAAAVSYSLELPKDATTLVRLYYDVEVKREGRTFSVRLDAIGKNTGKIEIYERIREAEGRGVQGTIHIANEVSQKLWNNTVAVIESDGVQQNVDDKEAKLQLYINVNFSALSLTLRHRYNAVDEMPNKQLLEIIKILEGIMLKNFDIGNGVLRKIEVPRHIGWE